MADWRPRGRRGRVPGVSGLGARRVLFGRPREEVRNFSGACACSDRRIAAGRSQRRDRRRHRVHRFSSRTASHRATSHSRAQSCGRASIRPRKVSVEVSWNPWFWGTKSFKGTLQTSAARDFTVKIDAKHLWPGLQVLVPLQGLTDRQQPSQRHLQRGRDVQDRTVVVEEVERRVHLGRRLRRPARVTA